MGEEKTSLGGIHISPNAVATIAYHATLESYGVVGLAPKNIADGIVKTITREAFAGRICSLQWRRYRHRDSYHRGIWDAYQLGGGKRGEYRALPGGKGIRSESQHHQRPRGRAAREQS